MVAPAVISKAKPYLRVADFRKGIDTVSEWDHSRPKTSSPNRFGLCGCGLSSPESDHRLSRRCGSVPSHRFRFAVQTEPGSGGSFLASSSKLPQGMATSRLQ